MSIERKVKKSRFRQQQHLNTFLRFKPPYILLKFLFHTKKKAFKHQLYIFLILKQIQTYTNWQHIKNILNTTPYYSLQDDRG